MQASRTRSSIRRRVIEALRGHGITDMGTQSSAADDLDRTRERSAVGPSVESSARSGRRDGLGGARAHLVGLGVLSLLLVRVPEQDVRGRFVRPQFDRPFEVLDRLRYASQAEMGFAGPDVCIGGSLGGIELERSRPAVHRLADFPDLRLQNARPSMASDTRGLTLHTEL